MWFDPIVDPFVETGYLGYSLRGIAHHQPDRTFRASLEIRDYRHGEGDLLYESMFSETFVGADAAIARAMGRGEQVVDDLLHVMDIEETVAIKRQ